MDADEIDDDPEDEATCLQCDGHYMRDDGCDKDDDFCSDECYESALDAIEDDAHFDRRHDR